MHDVDLLPLNESRNAFLVAAHLNVPVRLRLGKCGISFTGQCTAYGHGDIDTQIQDCLGRDARNSAQVSQKRMGEDVLHTCNR
jgi:hypothetical protein